MSADTLNRIQNIPHHYNDPGWLRENEPLLRDDFTAIFQTGDQTVGEAVAGLLQIYPYVIHHGDVKQWSNLLQRGLMAYERQFPRPLMAEDSRAIQFYLTDHEGDEVIEAEFAVALKRARKRIRPTMILRAYTNLLRKYVFHQAGDFHLDLLTSTLSLGRQVNEQVAYGELHLTLAYVYIQLEYLDKAMAQAETAYHYWQTTREEFPTALSLYAIATIHNRQGRFDEALPWFEQAERAFLDLNRPRYRGYVAYEMSIHYHDQRDFTEADRWAAVALEEIIRTESDYTRAAFEYWRGVTLTRVGKYDEAKPLLEATMRYWRGRRDSLFMARVAAAMAHLEGCAGHQEEAMQSLNDASGSLAEAPDSPEKAALHNTIERLRKALENGEELTDL